METIQLKIHWKATAIATAAPRIVLGKTSAISTQHIGPHENIKLAEYTMMLAIHRSSKDGLPKVTATPKAPRAIPKEPVINKGFRPNFSTVKTATKVNDILTISEKELEDYLKESYYREMSE